MTPHVKRLTVDPFPVRLVGHANVGVAGPARGAVDRHRHEHLEAVFGQAAGELRVRGNSRRQAGDLFRRLVRVG